MFIPAAQDEHHHDGEEAGLDLVNGHLGLGNRLPEGKVEGQDEELMQHLEEQPEPGHLAGLCSVSSLCVTLKLSSMYVDTCF